MYELITIEQLRLFITVMNSCVINTELLEDENNCYSVFLTFQRSETETTIKKCVLATARNEMRIFKKIETAIEVLRDLRIFDFKISLANTD
jgi:hypothetical protein